MHASKANIAIGCATRNDLNAVIALHCACFDTREHIGMLFGRRFIAACYEWFLTSGQGYILVARLDGKIVGAISVSDSPYDATMMQACRKHVISGFVRHPWLVFHPAILKRICWSFLSRINRKSARQVQDCAQEGFIMVAREHRGKGIATLLRQEAMHHSASRGSACFFSYMKTENIASRRPYEKLGFIEVHELASRGFVCMRKELQETSNVPLNVK